MQIIFQDPFSSLNPRHTVSSIIAAPLEIHRLAQGKEVEERIADLLDKPLDEVKRMLGLNERVTSVDTPYGKDADKPLLDTIPDENVTDPTDRLQADRINAHLDDWLSKLNEKQREVVLRRFGLRGYENSTLEEVANELGVTRERVRQIQMDALKRLRLILEQEGFSLEAIFK